MTTTRARVDVRSWTLDPATQRSSNWIESIYSGDGPNVSVSLATHDLVHEDPSGLGRHVWGHLDRAMMDLTPTAARELAAALLRAADAVEVSP